MIRILVADDHQIFIDGIAVLINSIENMEIVATANNGAEVIDELSKTEIDVVLMDINMPIVNGFEATQHVIANYPSCKVLMLTMHNTKNYIEKLLKAGAHGYVLKNTGIEELEKAILTVVKGETYFSPEVSQTIMASLQQRDKIQREHDDIKLTDREKEVLKLIAGEFTTGEIAEKLFISKHTVESHRKNLISKLGVRSAAGLVKYAVQMGLD